MIENSNFIVESVRLKTFNIQWPLSSPTPEDLAAAGFYYLGDKDRVRCGFCGIQVGKWEKEDNPMMLHDEWSPSCQFIINRRKKEKNNLDDLTREMIAFTSTCNKQKKKK